MGHCVKVIVGNEERYLTESFVALCRRQMEKLEEDIKKHHRTVNSVRDWSKLCQNAGVTEIEMRARLLGSGRYNLASPLGWAWLTQIYLPAQESAPCPRSRVWQIEERMHRDYRIAMQSEKRAKGDCPFDFQLCYAESCLPDDIPSDCPVLKK